MRVAGIRDDDPNRFEVKNEDAEDTTTQAQPGRQGPKPLGAPQAQLGAEWVDIQNVGQSAVNLDDVELYHVANGPSHPNGQWEQVMTFTGNLPAGKTMRVHSGSGPVSELSTEDLAGADYHLFTNRDNHIWNNAEGDCSGLFVKGNSSPFDRACYASNPPEGVTLHRLGDTLVAAATTAGVGRSY